MKASRPLSSTQAAWPSSLLEGVQLPRLETEKLTVPVKVQLAAKEAPVLDVIRFVAEKADLSVLFDLDDPHGVASRVVHVYARDLEAGELLQHVAQAANLAITCVDPKCDVLSVRDRISFSYRMPVQLYDDSADISTAGVTIQTEGDLASTLKEHLTALLSEGTVVINPVTGWVRFEGPPSQVRAAVDYLRSVVRELSKYVFVKAYIIKLNSQRLHERGLDVEQVFNLGDSYSKSLGIAYSPGVPDAPSVSVDLDYRRLKASIRMIEEEALGEVISAPLIMVRSGAAAAIRITKEIGWFEPGEVDTTISDGTVVYERNKPSFNREDVGVTMVIRPVVATEHHVQAVLTIEDRDLESYATYTWQERSDVPAVELRYPLLFTRSIVTEIVAEKGKYVLLGGFRETRVEDSVRGIPFLKDLPIIGHLTNHVRNDKQENDLYVAVGFRVIQ